MSDSTQGPAETWPPAPTQRSNRPLIIVGLVVLLVVAAGVVVATRGGGGPDRSTPEGQLEYDVHLLADGRFAEAYQDMHPAQKAIISQDTYVRCLEEVTPFAIKSFKVGHIGDERIDIPGTDLHVDSKAITATLDTGARARPGDRHLPRDPGRREVDLHRVGRRGHGQGRLLLTSLSWRLSHPATVHLQGLTPEGRLVAIVAHYDEPGGPHWLAFIRGHQVGGRMATSAEAQAVAEEAWTAGG